jgi:hydroxyacylglutathione hydrolase
MADIPLEDSYADIIGKAQRGLKISDEDLSSRAGIGTDDLAKIKGGEFDEALVRKVAPVLSLGENQLVELGQKAWYPDPIELHGLAQFNSQYEDMTVNSYLVYELFTKVAVAFDTGANATELLAFAQKHLLRIKLILLTHAHTDHIIELPRIRKSTMNAPVYSSEAEPIEGTETFAPGKKFEVGNFWIETRQTSGHAAGGITYVVSGLKRKLAIVGDALFCSSMGGGMVSYDEALRTNRESIFSLPDDVIICPGHGPMTTVGDQKRHNPFFPEFAK